MRKILFISNEGSITGAPLFLNKLVRYLKVERPDLFIAIFFSKEGELVELLKNDGFDVFVSEKHAKANSKKILKLSKLFKHFLYYIKVLIIFRPNLIYSNTILNFGEVFWGKIFRIPVLLHIHEGKKFCSAFRNRLMISCLLAKRVIVGSSYVNNVLESLTKHSGIVVHNGVNVPIEIPIKPILKGVPFNIGILGTIDSNKGQLVALEAIYLLAKRGLSTKLKIAGKVVDERYYAQLRGFIKQNSINDFVEFVGIVPDAINFLNSIDLLVVPSFDEAFPTVILEAFSAGTLVVASNVGGIPEMIETGVNGVLFTAGDPMMLADTIEKVIVDETLLRELPMSALKVLQKRFDVRSTNRLVAINLDEMLLSSGR